jgi:hypothetical protein
MGNSMAKSLVQEARSFIRSNPRSNPPGDDMDTRFNEFIVWLKERGLKMSDWSEGDWFQAAREFGFDEDDLGSLMEQVAAWGVDD